jgi:uncharacterized membrane protein
MYLDSLSLPRWGFSLPGLPEFLLAQTAFLAGWEAAAHRRQSRPEHAWLEARWFPRTVGFVTLAALTFRLSLMILDHRQADYAAHLFLPEGIACPALYALLLFGGRLWYRKKRPDLFMLSCGVFSLAALCFCLLVSAMDTRWDVGTFFLLGLVVVGLTAGCGIVLRRLQQALEAEKAAKREGQGAGFPEKARSLFSWDALWDHLREAKLLKTEPPQVPTKSATPWYIVVQLAAGGWIAAIFLTCFLGLFLTLSLGRSFSSLEGPLFIGGCIFLAAARVWLPSPTAKRKGVLSLAP